MGSRFFNARVVVSFLAFAAPVPLGLLAAVGPVGCSKPDAEEAPPAPEEPEWVPPHRRDAGVDASDASDAGFDSSDGRAEQQAAMLLDAGRFCGSRDLHDCPLQGWMKRNANTMLELGDIAALGMVFDQMAALAPTETTADGGLVYANWKSISFDGANATRAGDMIASRAACRGCHAQYRASYHANLRARELPMIPSAIPPPP